jgi:hypothetical protein
MQGTASNDYVRKLDELDRLLNDPGVPMQPELIWRLLDEIAKWEHDRPWHGALLDHRADGEAGKPFPSIEFVAKPPESGKCASARLRG